MVFSRVYFVKHPLITTVHGIAVVVREHSCRDASSHATAVLYAYHLDVDPEARAQIIKSGPFVQTEEGEGKSGVEAKGDSTVPHTHAFRRCGELNRVRKKRSVQDTSGRWKKMIRSV